MTEYNLSPEREQLIQAIAAQESLRGVIDDAIIDATIATLQEKLDSLQESTQRQRKLVSILFTDIVGSTQMSRDLDPDEVLEVMDGSLERLAVPVGQHGGHVTRFMGDGFMAVFGLPEAHENDARQAIRAGLKIVEVAKSIAADLERRYQIPEFSVRVGINTGMVAAGGVSEAEDTIMGLTVNLAARLESAAPPGGVLISDYTHRLVRGVFDMDPQAPVVAKGFAEPVPVYLVTRSRPRAFQTVSRGVMGLETHLIGRENELGQIQALFRDYLQDANPRVITLVGDTGVGKSRLMDQFIRSVESGPEIVSVLKGRAFQQLANTPYGLLREVFTNYFDILDSDPIAVVVQKLETGFVRHLAQKPQMKAHFVGALLGFDLSQSPYLQGVQDDPAQLRDRALFYVVQFFEALVGQARTTLFLEDVHWADDPSLEALSQVSQGNSNPGLMTFHITRPELFERYPDWETIQARGGTQHTIIKLNQLSDSLCASLVKEILHKVVDLPDTLCDLIISTAEGNPYYVEELIKVLIEDGVILVHDNTSKWDVDEGKLHTLRIPSTLTAVLQARLDRLTRPEKSTLQQAAVVGRVFWGSVLGDLRRHAETPSPVLDPLLAKELIQQHEQPALLGFDEYEFSNAMLRDVTYSTVPLHIRRDYHKGVAAWLEKVLGADPRGETFAGMIAEHYDLAGERTAAADWYMAAAEQSKAQGALTQARQFFDQAYRLIPESDIDRQWKALLGRNYILGLLGEIELKQADDEALLTLAKEKANDNWLAEAHYQNGYSASIKGEYTKAIAEYKIAFDAAIRANCRELQVNILSLETESLTQIDEIEEAEAVAEKTLAYANQLDDELTLAKALTNVSSLFTANGNLAKSVELLQQQVAITNRLGNLFGEQVGLNNLGYNYILLGRYEKGRDALERARNLTEAIGARRIHAYVLLNLGLAYIRGMETENALQILDQVTPKIRSVGDRFGEAASFLYRAMAWELAKKYHTSAEFFLEAKVIYSEIGAYSHVVDANVGFIRCLWQNGDRDQALELAMKVWHYLLEKGSQGLEFPILAYKTCAETFDAASDRVLKEKVVRAGYTELQRCAERISDPDWRKSFLESVPEHHAITVLWNNISKG